jgi:hypothetical protein
MCTVYKCKYVANVFLCGLALRITMHVSAWHDPVDLETQVRAGGQEGMCITALRRKLGPSQTVSARRALEETDRAFIERSSS